MKKIFMVLSHGEETKSVSETMIAFQYGDLVWNRLRTDASEETETLYINSAGCEVLMIREVGNDVEDEEIERD